MLSKLWAHIGTVLAGLGAALGDFRVVAVSSDVRVALTAVAGLLVTMHIITPQAEKSVVADAKDIGHELSSVTKAVSEALRQASQSQQQPHA